MNLKYKTFPNCTPSFAEKMLANEMDARDIRYAREVNFDGCNNPDTGAPLRYDFYLPEYNAIIEYDGADFHEDIDVQLRDNFKDNFAANHGIKLIRIRGLRNIAGSISNLGLKKIKVVKGEKYHHKKVKPNVGNVDTYLKALNDSINKPRKAVLNAKLPVRSEKIEALKRLTAQKIKEQLSN